MQLMLITLDLALSMKVLMKYVVLLIHLKMVELWKEKIILMEILKDLCSKKIKRVLIFL